VYRYTIYDTASDYPSGGVCECPGVASVAVRAHQQVFYHRFAVLFTHRVGSLGVCLLVVVDVPTASFTPLDDYSLG
jgi:hypothetical protein